MLTLSTLFASLKLYVCNTEVGVSTFIPTKNNKGLRHKPQALVVFATMVQAFFYSVIRPYNCLALTMPYFGPSCVNCSNHSAPFCTCLCHIFYPLLLGIGLIMSS